MVSGGAYFINATSSGQQLKLKEGKSYSVQFPKISDDEMTLFYGERDSTDNLNWKKAEQKLEVDNPGQDGQKEYKAVIITGSGKFSDTSIVPMKNVTKEKANKIRQEQKVYNPASISKFGWINCDRFYDLNAPATNVRYTITNGAEEVNYVIVYLIFQDIRSVMQSSYNFYDENPGKNVFSKIPVGLNVRFVAVCYLHGKIFASITDVKQVTIDHNEQLSLQQMSEGDFDNLIGSTE